MIFSIKEGEGGNRSDGANMHMLSRSGKATSSQYMAFSKHKKQASIDFEEPQPNFLEGMGEEFGSLQIEPKATLAQTMQQIEEEEKRALQEQRVR